MRTNRPTAVREDYLRAIFRAHERGDGSVRLIDISTHLGLSRSTVSERVRELVAQGLVEHTKYGHVHLTRRGYAIAQNVTHKHRVMEVFLHDVLKLSKSEAHEEAHKLEHALSDKVIKRIGVLLGSPQVDPHGSRIPQLQS